MYEQIISLIVAVTCLIVTYQKTAVMIVVKRISVTACILNEGGMIERVMETYALHIPEIVIQVYYFKAAELIAGRKDKLAAMLICEPVAGIVCRLWIDDCISVLSNTI